MQKLVTGLPGDFPAPIVAVLHVGDGPSHLPSLLSHIGRLKASHVENGDRLQSGHIHVAPPDHHVLVVDGRLELSRGPRENWVRPAIDPTFRTAAEAYGPAAVGVVLTGRLNDGSAGLYEIKRRGGIAVVQTPNDAEVPQMPLSAVNTVTVDFVVPIREMPPLLTRLAGEPRELKASPIEKNWIIAPSAQTCPECGGAMRKQQLGRLTQFRCHIGHVMTAEVLAANQLEQLQKNLETTLRTLNERAALCREMASREAADGNMDAAGRWEQAAAEATRCEQTLRRLSEGGWAHPETEGAG